MKIGEEGRKLVQAILGLGTRRLIILAAVGLAVTAVVAGAAYFLNRPQYEVLYAGLDSQDAPRIVAAMREASLNFDVSADGATIYVEYGQGPHARMLLAERGLPRNAVAGYEIFDKIGSLGLTSFMQEIAKVRALEGELARSIQTMQGVQSARVHLVLPGDGFRKKQAGASASVIVKALTPDEQGLARAIRYLVAAAAPGLTPETVTVLSTDGAVLAGGAEPETGASTRSIGLERSLAEMLQNNVRRALSPMLGARRFNVSVVAKINTDARQTNEIVYNPDSRVERSVRVVKENQTSQNSNSLSATSIERNIPTDRPKGDAKSSAEDTQKKDELTNYEVSSKSIVTTSGGYAIERLSVALVVDRAALAGGGDQAAIDHRLSDFSDLAASAVGLNKERGDVIKIVAADFLDETPGESGGEAVGLLHLAMQQLGGIFKALAFVAVAGLVTAFGIRPVAQSLLATADKTAPAVVQDAASTALMPPASSPPAEAPPEVEESPRRAGQRRLERIVANDEEQAAAVLRQWVRAGESV